MDEAGKRRRAKRLARAGRAAARVRRLVGGPLQRRLWRKYGWDQDKPSS